MLAPIEAKPLPAWSRLWSAPHKFKWYLGGYGTSKTTFAAWTAFVNATVVHPGYTGILAAPTYKLLWQSLFKEFAHWFQPLSGLFEVAHAGQEGGAIRFGNGSVIVLRSTTDETSLEGLNAAWVVFDEAAREPRAGSFNVMAARVRRGYPGRPPLVLVTGVPQGRSHWTAREFGTGHGDGFVGDDREWSSDDHLTVRSRTRDNPHLPADYERSLRSRAGITKAWCEQYLDGGFASVEGAIWPQFDRAKHVVKASTLTGRKWRKVLCGVDWGWTHPGVMLVCGVDGLGNVFVLHEEVHKERLVDESVNGWVTIAKQLVKAWGVAEFWCDPSSPGNMRMVAKSNVRTYPADNDVGEGIRRVGARLECVGATSKMPALYVSDACVETIKCIEGYGRKRVRGELVEAPQEIDDDPADALRYAVMGVGQ